MAKMILILVCIFLCLVCVVVGFYAGLMFAGLGICAVPFTWQLVFGVGIAASIIPFAAGISLPRLWWIPALLFDIPVFLPIFTKDPGRVMASLSCIIVATLAARFGSYLRKKRGGKGVAPQ